MPKPPFNLTADELAQLNDALDRQGDYIGEDEELSREYGPVFDSLCAKLAAGGLIDRMSI